MEFNPDKLSEVLKDPTLRLSGVADISGVSLGTLYALRDKKKKPSAATLGRIATALEKPVEYFFDLASPYRENVANG